MAADHWERARGAARASGVELRPLTELADADPIISVMAATWGEFQVIPREVIRALQHSGNVPYGALAGGDLVGYVLGWAGVDEEGLHVHSHMLAVLPEWRAKGVGLALKLAQRAQALDRGIRVARWTFDPLVARNAYFNLVKLGADADGFHRNFYGDMTDLLNRGERTDRLVIRWDLGREPGRAPAEAEEATVVLDREGSEDAPRPSEVRAPEVGPALVRVPRDHAELRERDGELARAWRDAAADAIEACFAAGLVAHGFTRDGGYLFS